MPLDIRIRFGRAIRRIREVQLKSRLTFEKKYLERDLHICFPDGEQWFLYPHDTFLKKVLTATTIGKTGSWKNRGKYSFPTLSRKLRDMLKPYRLVAEPARGVAPIPED